MAQHQNQDMTKIGFRSIQLLKSQTLGIGSYGKVCKAKCDDLLCAAKIIHETLFDPTAQQQIEHHREHRVPFRRFQQECEFMSAIKHPNIVQYLGIHQDPETGLPVLLMELMDDSLTHFLESSQDPVPYHIKVNFCHDITLAISYLHLNGIIHRDLSSNNVLLRANVIAKVTDFGMAKLGDANPQATRISLTMVPGTDVYMPPEAVKEQPVYTAKIDCFAIGTLIIQILTKRWPKPGERLKSVRTTDPQFPGGIVRVPASEIERRQNHISQVDPNHPLLPIALHCLKDSDVERPSAEELCHRVAALKETPQYTESPRSAQERSPEQDNTTEREEQIRELQQQIQQKDDIIQGKDVVIQQRAQQIQQKDDVIQEKDDVIQNLRGQYTRQIQGLQQLIGSQNNQIQEKEQTISAQQQECQQLRETIRDKDRELQRLTQQLQISKDLRAQFQRRQTLDKNSRPNIQPKPKIAPKPKTKPLTQPKNFSFRQSNSDASSRGGTKNRIDLTWKVGDKAPRTMCRAQNGVVDDDTAYFCPFEVESKTSQPIYAYNLTAGKWNQLPDCPTQWCSLAVINNVLTTIGGIRDMDKVTRKLFSIIGEGENRRWGEVFPPMLTGRYLPIAVCTGQALIVAGGQYRNLLLTVEVMDTATKQWSIAADLPEPLYSASATICGDRIYMLGGRSNNDKSTKSVYTCSLAELFRTCQSRFQYLKLTGQDGSALWSKVADLPVTGSTCVTLHGRLLAIGGCDSASEPTSDVRIYNAVFNRWEIISQMTVDRLYCFAAVFPSNQLMVVGGYTGLMMGSITDSVEIANVA